MPQPFSDLYDFVLPYLPGAEIPLVDASIRKAARDFLRRTTLKREEFAFPTVPGVSQYQLNGLSGQVSSVMWVREEGQEGLLPVATEDYRRQNGRRTAWWSPTPTVLALYPTPEKVVEMRLEAAVTLPLDATDLPDNLLDTYAEVLASGVLSMMYAMPGKPWTSRDAAVVAGRAYSQEIKTIRGRLRDGGQSNQSTFSPTFKFGA